MLKLTYTFAGETQLSRGFQVMDAAGRDLSELFEDLDPILRENVGEQFQSEGAHSAAWTPLSKEYADWKDEHYPGRPILVRTAEMRQAFTVDPHVVIGPRRMEWGPNDNASYDNGVLIRDVADAHQGGLGRLPQRKIINLTAADRRDIDRAVVDWVSHLGRRIIGAL